MEVGGGELTIYDNLTRRPARPCWCDLCRGPHLPTTRLIPAFKLMRSRRRVLARQREEPAAAARSTAPRGRPQDALKAHLQLLEEAERRDHRKLGAELDLFSFPDEIGSGLAVFHPKGGIIRREMEDYSRRRHEEAGYEFVNTPHITKGAAVRDLRATCDWYADGMFPPMQLEGADYYLKPMNCPLHNLIFRSRGRSYRELPLRLFEFGTVYRYEKSGVVHGLTRVRGLTQDDAHIYCTKEQMPDELTLAADASCSTCCATTAWTTSTWSCPPGNSEKFVGADEDWEEATEALRAGGRGLRACDLVPDPGGAAFYGPKISVQAKDAIGRTWQMSTIQVDFNLPERFELEYQAADGTRQRPVMIHRALFGSIERFFGVLTEHYAGAFPAWLAPVQVVGIPIARRPRRRTCSDVRRRSCGRAGIRAEVDASDDRMQKKIRTAQQQKIPFMVLAGDEDVEAGHGVVPLPRRLAAQRRAGRRGGRGRSSTGSRAAENVGRRRPASPRAGDGARGSSRP